MKTISGLLVGLRDIRFNRSLIVLLVMLTTMLTSCSFNLALPGFDFSDPEYKSGAPSVAEVLGGISDATKPHDIRYAPDQDEVLALYQDVVGKIEDQGHQFMVARRIAELELQAATNTLGESDNVSFAEAINDLESLVAISDDEQWISSPQEKAQIYYLLSQAYDLSGNHDASVQNLGLALTTLGPFEDNTQASNTLKLESRFRRAEYYFSEEKHRLAAEDYTVVAAEPGTYQTHAKYMLGWSRFKQGDLDLALAAFLSTLEELLIEQESTVEAGTIPATRLKSRTELLADTQRITMITLDYLDGVESLAAGMAAKNKPDWQITIYRALADWYQEKERFQDRALTFETFLSENPLYAGAPAISLEVIETYRQASFIDDIESRKLAFVDSYDKQGEFYKFHGDEVFAQYSDTLLEFVDHIIAGLHATAQSDIVDSNSAGRFLEVAGWYQRWLLNFDGNSRTAKVTMLLAEALTDGGDTVGGVATYQSLIEDFPEFDQLEQAAYAVVVGLQVLAEKAHSENLSFDRNHEQIAAGLFFARQFPEATEAPATMVNVAKVLFDAKDYSQAQSIAEESLALWQLKNLGATRSSGANLWKTVMLIAAHSGFETGAFAAAESHYRELIASTPKDEELKTRLLASILKQAEQAEDNGDLELAIDNLDRLKEVDDKAELAIAAQFDMAALYERSGDLELAINQMARFRREYPAFHGVKDIPMRLVNLYEQTGKAGSAARELLAISKDSTHEVEVRRQALYRSGELFLTATDYPAAIEVFRDYAHTYEQPFSVRMEAMHHMDLLYQNTKEPEKRRFWLRKKKATFDATPTGLISERTRYLAANAAFELAIVRRESYEQVHLKLPLKKSLKQKHKSMTQAIKAFEETARYGVAEYTTGSTYQIASIYDSLAVALMRSDKPGGLNSLESEQYEILLEEQAYPFEEQSLDIHQLNLQRGWKSSWDQWVSASLVELAQLSPGRFKRDESGVGYAKTLY